MYLILGDRRVDVRPGRKWPYLPDPQPDIIHDGFVMVPESPERPAPRHYRIGIPGDKVVVPDSPVEILHHGEVIVPDSPERPAPKRCRVEIPTNVTLHAPTHRSVSQSEVFLL